MFRERFPFGQKGVPPLAESVVEGVGGKPDLAQAGRINQRIWTLERNQSYSITNVELQHITTIIECFIAVRRPHQRVGIECLGKLSLTHTEVGLVPVVVEINGTGVGASDIDCSSLGKRRLMGATSVDSPPNFIERAGQH